MASFVHIADQRNAKAIRRSGILAQRIGGGRRAVFCVPVIPDFSSTHQWARELRRRGYGASCAAQFRIGDDEPVWVGRYGRQHGVMSAAEAVALFRGGSYQRPSGLAGMRAGLVGRPRAKNDSDTSRPKGRLVSDVRGLEVLVGRSIGAREIRRVRSLPHLVGWRFFPEAKGRTPFWPARGEIKARRQRDSIDSQLG